MTHIEKFRFNIIVTVSMQLNEESLIAPTGYDWEDEELRGEATYTEFLYGYLYKYQKTGDGYWESFNIRKRDFEQQNSEDDDQFEKQEE